MITCSNKQTSTPVSKLTLQPEQPPQEQAWRFRRDLLLFAQMCKGGSWQPGVWFPSAVTRQIFRCMGRFPRGPTNLGFSLQWHLLFQKEVVSAAHMRQHQKRAKEDYRKFHCNPAHPSGPSQLGFVCFFWNLSQSSTEIGMADNITRSWWFCSV